MADPDTISGLQIWFKADSLIATHSNNDPVSSWTDSSGNGRHATQATGAKQPLFKTYADQGIFHGQSVVHFDGTDDWLQTAAITDIEQPNHIFIVFRLFTIPTANTDMITDGIDTTDRHLIGVRGADSGDPYATFAGTTITGSAARGADTKLTMLSAVFNGASSSLDKIESGVISVSADDSGSQGLGGVTLGARNTVDGAYTNVEIAEYIMYDSEITGADLTTVTDYLRDKYFAGRLDVLESTRPINLTGAGNSAQGVAYDGTNFYFSSSTTIFKYNASYTQTLSRDTQPDWPAGQTQINGMNYHDGYLWVGGNNFNGSPRKCWIHKYDPSDLTLDTTYLLDDAAYCEGGAWRDDEFWAIFHDSDNVSRYNSDFSTRLGVYTLSGLGGLSDNGPQSAVWGANDVLITNLHNINTDHRLDLHQWDGVSAFTYLGRVPALHPDVAPEGGVNYGTQGIHWQKVGPGKTGNTLLFAERNVNTTGAAEDTNNQNIARATMTSSHLTPTGSVAMIMQYTR